MARSIARDGIIHVIGPGGHSNMAAEEVLWRAGGLTSINAMCIDTALEARKRKMVTIGITSREFADNLPRNHPSRHPSGKNLYQEVDYFINCHLPYGDAAIEIEGCRQKTGPTATMGNVFAINLLVIETVKQLVTLGVEPPRWMSANMPGGDEANRANEEKYIPRIKHLG